MSTTMPAPLPSRTRPEAGVPLSRLVHVELRKLVDTRAGRWILAVIAAISALVLVISLFTIDPSQLDFRRLADNTQIPQSLLLPILGILSVTSEWTQRTVLTTFTLEPSRSRVVTARLLAAQTLGLAVILGAIVLAAAANLLGQALRGGSGGWDLGVSGVGELILAQMLVVAMGVVFGLLIMNTAGAISTYFVLPTIVAIAIAAIPALTDIGGWVSLSTATGPLAAHEMNGDAWLRLTVASLLWIVLPLVLGWTRLLRREVKST